MNSFSRISNDMPNALTVAWELTTTCNYSCWYCPESLHDGKYRWPDLDASLDFFYNLSSHKDIIHIDMVGGEPTLWPEIDTFLKNKPENCRVEISSNGSRTVKWWERNIINMDGVCLSFHPDSADPDHFFNVVETVSQHKDKPIHVFILAVKDKLDTCINLFNRLNDSGVEVDCNLKFVTIRKAVLNKNTLDRYKVTDELRHSIESLYFNKCRKREYDSKPCLVYKDGKEVTANLLVMNKENNFKGWSCTAGLNRMFIRGNGDIYRASCLNGGRIGNINYSSNVLQYKHVTCEMSSCDCLDEVKLEKYNNYAK